MNTKVFLLVKLAYSTLLRPLVAEKVQSSDAQWDDVVLSVLDKIFDYDGNSK